MCGHAVGLAAHAVGMKYHASITQATSSLTLTSRPRLLLFPLQRSRCFFCDIEKSLVLGWLFQNARMIWLARSSRVVFLISTNVCINHMTTHVMPFCSFFFVSVLLQLFGPMVKDAMAYCSRRQRLCHWTNQSLNYFKSASVCTTACHTYPQSHSQWYLNLPTLPTSILPVQTSN